MPMYALKSTIDNSILEYQEFGIDFEPPILSPLKNLCWVLEDIPSNLKGPTPQVVSMAQARLALLEAGLLPNVAAALAAIPGVEGEAARIKWEYSTTINRTDSLVAGLATGLDLSDIQLDTLFTRASQL